MSKSIVFACSLAACAPSYVVRYGYISRVTTSGAGVPGAQVYADDHGDGLVRAVADNPAAVDRAATARSRSRAARWLIYGSVACLGADAVVARASEDSTGAVSETVWKGGVGTAAACLVAMGVGGFLLASATHYELEAMELYNSYPTPDQEQHVDSRLAPHAETATASLHMR